MAKSSKRGRKHCGKKRNCSLRAISPFPAVFSKDLYCRHVKTRACMGKGLPHLKSSAFTLTLSQMTNFRFFQTGRVAEDNFKFNENGGRLSKRVENSVGKGEIANYKQFILFFYSVFKRFVLQTCKKKGLVGESIDSLPNGKISDRSKLKALQMTK